jgi:hypothetical protein
MKLNKMVKVRFNLAKGKNFMKWKIEYPDGNKEYLSPTENQLVLHNVLLKNYKTVAKKIFDGHGKVVCAWAICESIEIIRKAPFNQFDQDQSNKLNYNPKITPNWVHNGCNADGKVFKKVGSVNYQLFDLPAGT